MNKVIWLLPIMVVLNACSTNQKYTIYMNGIKDNCQFGASDVDFCSKEYKIKYDNQLKSKINFDKNKVLFYQKEDRTIVVLDPRTKHVYAIDILFYDAKKDDITTPILIQNNPNQDVFCVTGGMFGRHSLYDYGKFCFQFNDGRFTQLINKTNEVKKQYSRKELKKLFAEVESLENVKLPFSNNQIVNSTFDPNKNDELYDYISHYGGDIYPGCTLFKLPDYKNNFIFGTIKEEGDGDVFYYGINVLNKDGVLHSLSLGTGSLFTIDKNYVITVKDYKNDKLVTNKYFITDDGQFTEID